MSVVLQAQTESPLWQTVPEREWDRSETTEGYIDIVQLFRFTMFFSGLNSFGVLDDHSKTARLIREFNSTVEGGVESFPGYYKEIVSIWRALRQSYPDLPRTPYFENHDFVVILRTDFCNQLFSPIIPDSPILKFAIKNSYSEHFFGKLAQVVAVILLIVEAPFRYLACCSLSLLLKVYALKNSDFAEYYRFRLNINANHPLTMAFKAIFS